MSITVAAFLGEIVKIYNEYLYLWSEEAIGVFLFRTWQLLGSRDKDYFEEVLDYLIEGNYPKKLSNSAKTAKKLIKREKKMLSKVMRHGG